VTVLTSRAFDLPAETTQNGVRVLRVPVFFRRQLASANFPSMFAYLPMGAWAGQRLLRRETFDVINTHFVLPTGPVGQFLARISSVPNVLSVHGGDLFDPSKRSSPHRNALLRLVVRRLAFAANAIVAQSEDTLSNLHRYYAPEVKGDIIPLGIPRPAPVHASRAKYGFQDDDVILVTVGRLIPRKATEQLIELLAVSNDPRTKLIVVGSGPLTETLKAAAERRGVGARMTFTGHVDEGAKGELLSIADIFVSTSQHEGFGLVFLEAMAAGLPVICYDRGGQNDFLEDGKTGFVVRLNDQATFTERCKQLIASSDLRRRMSAHNKSRVERYFIDRCADAYEKLFESAIRSAAGRAVAAP
jgi:glycosyltransferase involved in cell wall biosynthesis